MSWVRRHRMVVLLAVATAVAAGIPAVVLVRSSSSPSAVEKGGPLAEYNNRTETTAVLAFDRPYTWGAAVIGNTGDEVATIDSLALVNQGEPVRVLGITMVPTSELVHVSFGEGYEKVGADPEGLALEPHRDYQFVVGLALAGKGRYVIPGIRVRYYVAKTATRPWRRTG